MQSFTVISSTLQYLQVENETKQLLLDVPEPSMNNKRPRVSGDDIL